MAYDPSIFNINPYYDDYDPEKAFLRVLFKPGYALQARELTQLQSILQNQVTKMSDHLFKDGSRIVGGGITVRNSSFVKIDPNQGDIASLSSDEYSSLVGGILNSGQASARIVHFIPPEITKESYLTLVVDFLSGNGFTDTTVVSFEKGDVTYNNLVLDPSTSSTENTTCKSVSVGDGIFYVDGFFVQVKAQTFTPYRFVSSGSSSSRDLNFSRFSALDKKIGFSVVRDSVTEQEDSTLRDPSIGSYNYNAPGADRYKIVLQLAQHELSETPDDFIELLRFEGGKITKKVDRVVYGDIQKALATRTYDESGSYTTKPFDLSLKEFFNPSDPQDTDASKLSLSVGEGKAYVFGYEVENIHPNTSVVVNKARTLKTEEDKIFSFSVGNYIDGVVGGASQFGTTFAANIVTIGSGSAIVRFFNTQNQQIASGYVHGAIPHQTNNTTEGYGYRFYLYGLEGTVSGASYAHIFRHGQGNTVYGFVTSARTDRQFSIESADSQSLVYDVQPAYAVASFDSVRVVGKLIGDVFPSGDNVIVQPDFPTIGQTTFKIKKSHFSSAIASSDDRVFRFLPSRTGVNLENTVDIQQVSFINTQNGNSYTPSSGFIYTNSDDSELTLVVSGVPAEFSSSSAVLRAVAPIVYTPIISIESTIRTKTVRANVSQGFSSLNFSFDSSNERKYFLLANTDIFSVASVTYTTETGAVVNVTDHFELDDGQRDSYYDYGRLYIKNFKQSDPLYTSENSAVQLVVTYSYFEHGGLQSAPFVGHHSYISGFTYENIPLFTSTRTGKTVSLANCLDFRRSTPTSEVPMIKPYGVFEFGGSPGDTTVTYSHYLPRMDKVCLKVDTEDSSPMFFVVEGTPDLSPTAPPDPDNALVLATLTVPAYTHSPSDVTITPIDNRRFTMADIGKMQKRIDEVELFAKLSISESEIEARSLSIGSEPEPIKTSIFSDEFYGHSIGDVVNTQYSCSVDFERGELRPFFTSRRIAFTPQSISGATISSDGLLSVDYSGITYVDNKQYTTKIKINPSGTVNWLGFMKLDSSVDGFYDSTYRPLVKTNALGENDNWISANPNNADGFGTQWNDWESIWTGIDEIAEEQDDIQKRIIEKPHTVSNSAVPSFTNGSVRVGVSRKIDTINEKTSNYIRARNLKNRIKYHVGSRLVDRSVVPYIPSRQVTGTVHGLKPLTTNLSVYFDGEVVQSGIATDSNGSCSFSFIIPPNKFTVGSKSVRISDTASIFNSETSADAVYHCSGILEQRSSGCYSTRPPELRRLLTSSEYVSKDPFNRDIDSVSNTHWSDPLSQTFFVDKKTTPNGIFLNKVTLYFASKDANLPVTVQIRPTVSGYPSPSVVVPFSTVTKIPNSVQIGTTPKATDFVFNSPVYLEPGEYALCVLTNSPEYQLFAADAAINAIATTDSFSGRAGNDQLVGTLYTSQGIGPCAANNNTDIMFSVQRCSFTRFGSGSVVWNTQNCTNSQVLKIYAPEIVPEGSSVSRTIGNIPFLNNDSLYLPSLFSGSSEPNVRHTLSVGSDTNVSPVIDVGAICGISVKMYRNTDPSSYISRIVELPSDLSSNGLAVFLDANLPLNSSVRVYYRYTRQGESDVLNKQWIEITRITPPFSSRSEIDFREVEYRLPTNSADLFNSYQIRVDLASDISNPTYSQTPSIRNIRAVSFRRV